MTGSAKITQFPGASQVPTVGQRLCPIMSKTFPVPGGQVGNIQVQCAGVQCRLWSWCSGEIAEKLIAGIASVADALDARERKA